MHFTLPEIFQFHLISLIMRTLEFVGIFIFCHKIAGALHCELDKCTFYEHSIVSMSYIICIHVIFILGREMEDSSWCQQPLQL